jgi:hypothetical protein
MNVQPFAWRMRELASWIESQEGDPAERHEFHRAPQGRVLVTIDPSSAAPAASFNRNRICLCGAEGGLTQDGLNEHVAMFEARSIPRVFAWLSPGPDIDLVREWLRALSFAKVQWTRYPTMVLAAEAEPVQAHPFEIRQVSAADFAGARCALGDAVLDGYASTLGKPGFFHYILYDNARPIAAAALVKFGEIGYLTYAGTIERERRRGAQCALIAHRVAMAQSMGCSHIVSQTLTMLEDSFANLQRSGFREVYEQEVFEYVRK